MQLLIARIIPPLRRIYPSLSGRLYWEALSTLQLMRKNIRTQLHIIVDRRLSIHTAE